MLITISGLSGSGKTTTANMLAKQLGIRAVDVGAMFRKRALRAGMNVVSFGKYAKHHPEVDRALDATILQKAKKEKSLILQGRLTGLLTAHASIPAVRIWLHAPLQTRASRIARRESQPYKKTLHMTAKRDSENRTRYKLIYGLDLNDKSIYDIVVRTGGRSPEQIISTLVKEIPHIWQKKKKT